MRIDLNTKGPEAADAGQESKPGTRVSRTTGGGMQAEDSAELSRDQAGVQALSTAVTGLPEIRQERVSTLAQKIQEGSYAVTPEQTAEAVMSAMQMRSVA